MQNNEVACISDAINLFSRIRGIGNNSARRITLDLIKKKNSLLKPLLEVLQFVSDNIKECKYCNNLDVAEVCYICRNESRNKSIICIVDDVKSVWSIEHTNSYHGQYFILGGLLSAHKNITPRDIHIDMLLNHIKHNNAQEIIFATPADIEGQVTKNYITEYLTGIDIKISTLAQGIPIGGSIEYLDDITIATAINSRTFL